MKKNLCKFLLSVAFVLALFGCKTPTEQTPTVPETEVPTEQTPTVPETEEPTEEDGYPVTDLDDGRRKAPYNLEVNANGNDVVYFGERFTAEGYDVKFLFLEYENMGTNKSQFSAITLTNFTFDDSKVDYRKEGAYVVKFTGRVRSDVLSLNVFIYVKADRYEYLGVEHLYGISCDEYVNCALNADVKTIVPTNLTGIYTENKYENEELVKSNKALTEGYTLDTSSVNTSVAGSYPVYVSYSETYGDVVIKVETFFIVNVA